MVLTLSVPLCPCLFAPLPQRVEQDLEWSLFCPNEAPGLADCWGEKFNELYTKYEQEGRAKKVVRAQQLWFAILEAQVETGNPYMLYKDHCNRKSNQQNLGTIKCSNLCTEIIEYTRCGATAGTAAYPDTVIACKLVAPNIAPSAHGIKNYLFSWARSLVLLLAHSGVLSFLVFLQPR